MAPRRIVPAAAVVLLLASAVPARADMLFPTFVADSLYLGFPAGPIVGLALATSAILSFRWLRVRGYRGWIAAPVCILAYLALNFGVFMLALALGTAQPPRPPKNFQLVTPPAPATPVAK